MRGCSWIQGVAASREPCPDVFGCAQFEHLVLPPVLPRESGLSSPGRATSVALVICNCNRRPTSTASVGGRSTANSTRTAGSRCGCAHGRVTGSTRGLRSGSARGPKRSPSSIRSPAPRRSSTRTTTRRADVVLDLARGWVLSGRSAGPTGVSPQAGSDRSGRRAAPGGTSGATPPRRPLQCYPQTGRCPQMAGTWSPHSPNRVSRLALSGASGRESIPPWTVGRQRGGACWGRCCLADSSGS